MRMCKGMKSETHWQWHGEQRKQMRLDALTAQKNEKAFNMSFLFRWLIENFLMKQQQPVNSSRVQRIDAHARARNCTMAVASKQWDWKVESTKCTSTAHIYATEEKKIIDCAPHGLTCFVAPIYWNQYNFNLLHRTPYHDCGASYGEIDWEWEMHVCLVGFIGFGVWCRWHCDNETKGQAWPRNSTLCHAAPDHAMLSVPLSISCRCFSRSLFKFSYFLSLYFVL